MKEDRDGVDGTDSGGAGDSPSEEDEGLRGIKLFSIMLALTMACFLMLLDNTILATAVPRITTEFHSITDIGWYGAAYQLSSAAMQPLTGKLYTNFGTKKTFMVFFFIFELGSLLCATARGSRAFIVGRAVAGWGSSGIQNGAFTILAGCVSLHRRPVLIGTVQGVAQFGLVVGPLVGGVLTQYASWRWCFYLNLPCGAVVALLLSFTHVPNQGAPKLPALAVVRDIHRKLDLLGFVLFAPSCVMLLLAVQWGGNTYPWRSGVIIGLFAGAAVCLLVWIAWNRHGQDAALIPTSLMTNIWAGCLTLGSLMGPLFGAAYYLPVYFQSVRGTDPSLSGVYMLPSIVSQLTMAILAGKLLRRVGYYLPFSVISSVLTTLGYGLLSTVTPHTAASKWVGYQILFGLGCGLGIQMPIIAIQTGTPPAQIPIAIGVAFCTATSGGALVLSFADAIFTNSLRSQLRESLSPATVANIISSGGTGFRRFVDPSQLITVIFAYAKSIDRVFYLLAGWAAIGLATAWGMGWNDIRKKHSVSKA